jgi:hypothetical protein
MKIIRNNWAIFFLIFQLHLLFLNLWVLPHYRHIQLTNFRLFLNAVGIIFALVLAYWSVKQIKSIILNYSVLRDFPETIGHKPLLGELFFAALSMQPWEVFEKSQPFFDQSKRDLTQAERKLNLQQKHRQRLRQRTVKQVQMYQQTLAGLHDWRVLLKNSVANTLANNFQPLLDNIQLNADLRQEIAKAKAELAAWQEKGTLDGPFDLELFTLVEKANIRLAELVKKAVNEDERINQIRQNLQKQADAMLKDPKLRPKLDSVALQVLEEVKDKTKQPLKPRDLRLVQYDFDRVASMAS